MPKAMCDNQCAVKENQTELPLMIIVVEDVNIHDDEVMKMVQGLSALPIDYRVLFVGKSHHIEAKNCYEVKVSDVERFFTFAKLVMFVSEHPMTSLIHKAVAKKAVPIAHVSVHGLKNYEGPAEEGNAFLFNNFNCFSMFSAVVRALENIKFPYDWQNILRAGKKLM